MSDCYTQPYESLNSTAKLIRLPKKEQRSRSVGRNFWTRLLASSNTSPHTSHPHSRRSESPSPTSCGSQNSTVIIHDSSQRNSRSSVRSSQSNFGQPMPRPRTSISRNSLSGRDSSANVNTTSTPECRKLSTSFPKTRTTVTVHLSKTSKTNSTPNLTEASQFSESSKSSEPRNRRASESQNWSRPISEKKKSLSVTSFTDVGEFQPFQNSANCISPGKKEPPRLELNSLQVFRQPKYRERKKAERKIRQLEHLSQNANCSELVNQLGRGVNPNTYENQNTLNLVNFINKDGFVTSSRRDAHIVNRSPARPVPPPSIQKTKAICRDHVYAEINEDHLNVFPEKNIVKTPIFKKKVTFSTFHEPVLESDPFSQSKKILPAKFWGIVQVTEALRARADEDRRRVANLCYYAIVTWAKDHSQKFLGKVDNSRWGECVYVVLEENYFEIRDGDGFVIVKHRFNDVSVVTQVQHDPCLFVYVGRCKFNGRVGVTIRFNKSKHVSVVLSSFGSRKL